jgi:hypothetical protein
VNGVALKSGAKTIEVKVTNLWVKAVKDRRGC